ncbi:MAG: hypothetical protein ACREGA_04170 [Candidatus Saccharimonadales bacterium]
MKLFKPRHNQSAGASSAPIFVSPPEMSAAQPAAVAKSHRKLRNWLIALGLIVIVLIIAIVAYRQFSAPPAPDATSQPSSQPITKH